MITRRRLIESFAAFAAFVTWKSEAMASKVWCRVDPTITFTDGSKVKITVMIGQENEQLVTGNIQMEVLYPAANPPTDVKLYRGMNGFDESVQLLLSFEYGILVKVPASESVPIRVRVEGNCAGFPDGEYDGVTNEWLPI